MTKKTHISESILQKRINRFKSIKRGYYSLIILISLYVLSIGAPLFFNSKAIIVKYEGEYHFPLFNSIFSYDNLEAKNVGQFKIKGKKKFGQPHYRLLKKQYQEENNGNWVLLPIYPYDPYEDVISEKDEQLFDLNSNGKWDPGESFIDENGNGIRDKYRYTNFPDSQHLLGTDNQGRDVLSR